VETVQTQADMMVREGVALRELLGEAFSVKLPVCREGLKALRELKAQGVQVTMTAVFSAQQALVCARGGADYVAPYVNRMDEIGNGCETVARIVRMLNVHGLPTRVLSASFRNVEQVNRVAEAGCHFVTLPPAFFEKLYWHPVTDAVADNFERDWKQAFDGKMPMDLL